MMIPCSRLLNLKLARYLPPFRQNSQFKTKLYMKSTFLDEKDSVDQLIKKYAPRLIYNTIVEKKMLQYEYLQKRKKVGIMDETDPAPLTLKYFDNEIQIKEEDLPQYPQTAQSKPLNFPYDTGITVETSESTPPRQPPSILDVASAAKEEVRKRHEQLKDMKNWMSSYENYDDHDIDTEVVDWKINYGTPDPKSRISNVACGGCGALLHCKDTAIPGYVPSEIFKNSVVDGGSTLDSIVCQRCHFLQNYNVALEVQVTPEDYPKVLATIGQKQGIVVLMVDLLDFPCSIWPGIGEIFGSGVPIVIVGNKVDVLPQDSRDFLKSVRKVLEESVRSQGFASFNIKDVVLISAKTGYGVEELITKLNGLQTMRGNVYIVGCTNVGKSSLFNALLQSDYCKSQAVDLIQRATTSVWPGTTLNTLKFPIKRPAGFRQYLRHQRLQMMEKVEAEERKFRKEQLKITKDPKYASLIGHIGITKISQSNPKRQDAFIINSQRGDSGILKLGIDEHSRDFAESKWCYDTPGVVQPDQIIHLLTTEELLLTLPKTIVVPQTFCLKPKSSIFIAGLARLDFVEGPGSVRLTVFSSNTLPITVCDLEDAEALYEELLGTELMKVPGGDKKRLSKWPKLEMAKEFSVTGVTWRESAVDVVLSSAGWIAVTGRAGLKYTFQAWTPEKRGTHLRDCLLPHAVGLTGKRIKNSVVYKKFRFFLRE